MSKSTSVYLEVILIENRNFQHRDRRFLISSASEVKLTASVEGMIFVMKHGWLLDGWESYRKACPSIMRVHHTEKRAGSSSLSYLGTACLQRTRRSERLALTQYC